jgi:hypothetical protein
MNAADIGSLELVVGPREPEVASGRFGLPTRLTNPRAQ